MKSKSEFFCLSAPGGAVCHSKADQILLSDNGGVCYYLSSQPCVLCVFVQSQQQVSLSRVYSCCKVAIGGERCGCYQPSTPVCKLCFHSANYCIFMVVVHMINCSDLFIFLFYKINAQITDCTILLNTVKRLRQPLSPD